MADQKVGAAESYVSPSNMTEQSSPPALADAELPVLPAPAPVRRGQANEAGGRAARETEKLAGKTPESARKAKEEADLRADVSERVRVGNAEATDKQPALADQKPSAVPEQTAATGRRDERAAGARDAAPAAPPPPAMAQSERTSSIVELVSPDATTRWRIVAGSSIERSTDEGAVWELVLTPPQDFLVQPQQFFRAGHAPSAAVVWVVGWRGAIFVTTNGRQFDPVPFPEKADLVSVVAVDDRQATVTTADGRRFSTSDRGKTWERR